MVIDSPWGKSIDVGGGFASPCHGQMTEEAEAKKARGRRDAKRGGQESLENSGGLENSQQPPSKKPPP
jgi:hypothetical protein